MAAATVLGGRSAVTSMVRTALAPHAETVPIADSHWVGQTADHILAVIEASRSTWQIWHVRAEAQRQVRSAGMCFLCRNRLCMTNPGTRS